MTTPRVRLILSIDGTNSTEWGVLDPFGGENCALPCHELIPLLIWRAGTINGVVSSVRRIHDMVKEGIVTDANGIQYDQVYLICGAVSQVQADMSSNCLSAHVTCKEWRQRV